MLDAAHTPNPLTPLSTPSSGTSRWKPVSIVTGIINIKGGYNTRGEAAEGIQYQIHDTTHQFVKLDKNAAWFLKGVGGVKAQKGDLKPVTVIELLHETFDQALAE